MIQGKRQGKKESGDKKMGVPKSFKTCEIVQQLRFMSRDQVESGLDHNAVKDYAFILHDIDTNADGTKKLPHWHIMIRFKDSVPTSSMVFSQKESEKFVENLRMLWHILRIQMHRRKRNI